MKKVVYITIIYFISLNFSLKSIAQDIKLDDPVITDTDIKGLKLGTIKEMISNENGVYHYSNILEQFQLTPEKMYRIDYSMLYYGFVFSDNYNPYQHFAWEDSLSSLNKKGQFKDVIKLANQLLEINPISVFANIEKAIALGGLSDQENEGSVKQETLRKEALKYLERYRVLVETILASGVGNSYENAIIITSPKDAQAVLRRFELTELSKTTNSGEGSLGNRYYDVYVVHNQKNKEKTYPIYFDITLAQKIGLPKIVDSYKEE